MIRGTVLLGGLLAEYSGTLTVQQEGIAVEGRTSKPNPEWTHTDEAGHWHAWSGDGRLPTLDSRPVPCDGMCGDPGHTDTEWFCPLCQEVVKPWYVNAYESKVIPGRMDLSVTLRFGRNDAHPPTEGEVNLRFTGTAAGGQFDVFGVAQYVDGEVRSGLSSFVGTARYLFTRRPGSRGAVRIG